MFLYDFLFVLIITLLLTIIFGSILGHRKDFSSLGFFFVILILATWSGGLWIVPFAPLLWGINWIGFLTIGIFFALLILAILPPPKKSRTKKEVSKKVEAEKEAITVLNIFFWIIVIGLIASIIIAYL